MPLPTEPIGSVPRSPEFQQAMGDHAAGTIDDRRFEEHLDGAVADTIARFEATGSPIVCDGEQSKPSFVTYPLAGIELDPNGVVIPFEDGHTRQLPVITEGPFAYGQLAGSFLPMAKRHATKPLKQAVIAASAMSLLYPGDGIDGYSQEQFIGDLVTQATADIRSCFDAGAECVQLDFTEGRLAVKLDPSKGLLRQFVALNNRVLANFSDEERQRIGVHTCPGGDHDSTHSADVDYSELIPDLLSLDVGRIYMQMANEPDPSASLQVVARHLRPSQTVYVGVIDVIDEQVETPLQVRDRVLQAAEHLPLAQLGTTDDCGFSPFADDVATSRDTAFAKIAARVEGTAMAADELGVS